MTINHVFLTVSIMEVTKNYTQTLGLTLTFFIELSVGMPHVVPK